tara:strand:- start:864 stop:8246 length:7383 start_codon:yes stop_codon:yes gene_type:complete
MPQRTPNFNFEYFKRGSDYTETSDRHRFVTLDYNMESYVGIVGIGITSGWTVEQVTGLTAQILPGKGIINGFAVESPYVFKRRSTMASGEREHEIVKLSTDPETDMTAAEALNYVSVRQEYEPTYNPDLPIENNYIKSVTPTELTLPDNADLYIVATRTHSNFYPNLSDYPTLTLPEPTRSDYSNYADYQVALDAYEAELAIIYAYDWRDDDDNHFTEVDFAYQTTFVKSASKVLLAEVQTRNGTISDIKTDNVDSLGNFRNKINQYAGNIIPNHRHGGTGPYDPPAINLETDIRRATLAKFNSSSGSSEFKVANYKNTLKTLGHQHEFYVDSNGNGYTLALLGDGDDHWHEIISYEIQEQVAALKPMDAHIHTLPTIEEDAWTDDSQFIVYVNGEVYGDETSPNISVDPAEGKLTLLNFIAGKTFSSYSASFEHYVDSTTDAKSNFSYSGKSSSLFGFMLDLQSTFNFSTADLTSSIEFGAETCVDVSRNPFVFGDVSNDVACTSFSGFYDLESQSSIGQTLMTNAGDQWLFVPKAADNISVTLTSKPAVYNVRIEILDNSEVTGKLRVENIAYVKASKINAGVLDIARIPFISHVGRLGAEFLPRQFPLVSKDGIKFSVSPSLTTPEYGHYHSLLMDPQDNGTTNQTFIDDDPVYYAFDENDNEYFIQHVHGVSNGEVQEEDNTNTYNWYVATGNNAATSVHTHEVISPVTGDPRVVYSIVEDAQGNLFVGTSSGFSVIPETTAYLFVINEIQIFIIEADLWTALNLAKPQYEKKSGLELIITSDTYLSQVTLAETELTSHGDSYLLEGEFDPKTGQDQIMVKTLDHFDLPEFKYTQEKRIEEVENNETIVGYKLINGITGEEVLPEDTEELSSDEDEDFIEIAIVERDLQDIPIWSTQITTTDGEDTTFCLGPDAIVHNTDIVNNFYKDWTNVDAPFYAGVFKQFFKDESDNLWIPTDSGLLVSRNYQNGETFALTTTPGINPVVSSVTEGATASIFVGTQTGIYKTTDDGRTWVESLSDNSGIKQVIRDYKVLSVVMYAFSEGKTIYRSNDNGDSWQDIGKLPTNAIGDVFAFNGQLFVSSDEALLKGPSIHSWSEVLSEKAFSFAMSNDNSKFYVGAYNKVYESTDGSNFSETITFQGHPFPALLENGVRTYEGYAYNNRSNAYFYKSNKYIENNSLTALVDFNNWVVDDGAWNNDTDIDIYIDKRLTYSTKKDIDDRETSGYKFTIDNDFGILDFSGSANLSEATDVFDNSISVEDASSFIEGDKILVESSVDAGSPPTRADNLNGSDLFSYYRSVEAYQDRLSNVRNMRFFGNVTSIVNNALVLDERVDRVVELPAKVYRIPNLESDSSIFCNIYDSYLSEIGEYTHEELEDKFSVHSDYRPYELNNAYLSNILHLTQAVRFVYPNINDKFVNSEFYDFNYSDDPLDDNYIGNYIDIDSSDTYNNLQFASEFQRRGAKTVNRLYAGTGDFDDKLFACTDIGIFWTDVTTSYNGNWNYIGQIQRPVADILVFNETTIYAATNDGVYSSTDLETWDLLEEPSISFPASRLNYRWSDSEIVEIASHSTKSYNNTDDEDNKYGVIKNEVDAPYAVLVENKKVKVTGTADRDGIYTIKKVLSNKQFEIMEEFDDDSLVADTGVTMKMGTWWEGFDGEDNSNNEGLINTLLVGGENNVAYFSNSVSWTQGKVNDVEDFDIIEVTPISNGLVLASAIGYDLEDRENNLLKSSNIGSEWDVHDKQKEIQATIVKSDETTFNNTILEIDYIGDVRAVNGQYDKLEAAIFNGSKLLFQGYCIWNDNIAGKNYIYLKGNNANNIVSENSAISLTLELWPSNINSITEVDDQKILFGTNRGVYTDKQSTILPNQPGGEIFAINSNAFVNNIDLTGTISSVTSKNDTGNVLMEFVSSQDIRSKELVGQTLYVTDLNEVLSATIIANSGKSVSGEVSIQIDLSYDDTWLGYVGKRVTIVGEKTKLYVTTVNPIKANQFDEGKIIITSNENLNVGKEYSISENSTSWIELYEALVPVSTISLGGTSNDNIVIGQEIRLSDKTGKTDLFVRFDRIVKNNEYAGFNLIAKETTSLATTISNIEIDSNTPYSVKLKAKEGIDLATAFNEGDQFDLSGISFESVPDFNNKRTTNDLDHYHETDLIGKTLIGEIGDIPTVVGSTVTIEITDDNGFDNSLTQQDGTLLENASIRLYNPSVYGNTDVFERVRSHTATTITIVVKDSSLWDYSAYNETKASIGWKWEIEAENYGFTKNIVYKDFAVYSSVATDAILSGSTDIYVANSAGFTIGDTIKILDTEGQSELNSVATIPDATSITISTSADKSYYIGKSPKIEVLSDIFENTHRHVVRKNQVQPIVVTEYRALGYPTSHSHRISPFLSQVNDILMKSDKIIAIGSSEIIYKSYNNGVDWLRLTDLSSQLGYGQTISSVTSGILDGNAFIVGTENGFVFREE